MVDVPNNGIGWLKERLSAHGSFARAALDALDALPFTIRSCDANQYLLREGDRPKVCQFLLDGFVCRHKIVGDGGRQIVAIHLPGDLIDVQQILLREADHNVQTLSEARVLVVAAEDLIACAHAHSSIALALWHETLIEVSVTREWVANIGRRSARARTAHLLCEMAMRSECAGLGSRELFELPMTQEQLGDTLGLTAVHINRTLKTLELDGLITRNKRSVTVADWRRLREAGDFATMYLHLAETEPDEGRG